jgi:multiple sugar transport system ATP-binding protein
VLAKAGSDKTLTVGVRPEAFKVADEGLPVKVAVVEELGADAYLYGTAEHNNEHQQIVARIDARMPVEKGSTIRLAAVPEKLHLFSTSTDERLTA